MKNTLPPVLLFFLSVTSNGQFNTIDKYGTSLSLSHTLLLKIDTIGNIKNEAKAGTEQKTDLQENNFKPILTLPLKSIRINSGFGGRIHPIMKSFKSHSGIDLKAFYEPVYSVGAGFVTQNGFRTVEGNFVKIRHGAIESIYCHLSKILVSVGEIVNAGAQIGISGNTGRSTGPHLHFGMKYNDQFINPELFLALFTSQ